MSLDPFDGKTWVAFLDIGGFARLIKDKPSAAREQLSDFYNVVYRAIPQHGECQGLVVSDCVVLWSKRAEGAPHEQLLDVLSIIRQIYSCCLGKGVLLIGAVAFGDFKYEKRIEHQNIGKKMILGKAYIDAYFETERPGKPKPGEVRLVKVPKGIMEDVDFLQQHCLESIGNNLIFHWQLSSLEGLHTFKKQWKKCSHIEYDERKRVLRNFAHSGNCFDLYN